mgnify:CR=1 FL=1
MGGAKRWRREGEEARRRERTKRGRKEEKREGYSWCYQEEKKKLFGGINGV